MAFRIKVGENGELVLNEGQPVFVDDTGKDFTFDQVQADWGTRMATLSSEAAGHRKGKAEVKGELAKWQELGEIDEVKELVQKGRTIDLAKFTKAEEVEAKIRAATEGLARENKALKDTYEAKLVEANGTINTLKGDLHRTIISKQFASAELFNGKTLLTADMAELLFGKNFRVEDGQAVYYEGGFDAAGDPIGSAMYSMRDPGKLAGFDEALDRIWQAYPHRERYTPSTGSGDSQPGQRGSGGGNGKSLLQQADEALKAGDTARSISLKLQYQQEQANGGTQTRQVPPQ